MRQLIIAFDVGNTNICIGVFNSENNSWNQWRLKTDINKTYDDYGMLLRQLFEYNKIPFNRAEGIIISSVVPEVMFNLDKGIAKYLGLQPITVTTDLNLGINIKYENPMQLGADRICNAVAAYTIYGGPVIVVDMGTATTVCAINQQGDFLGGAIIPGITSFPEVLFSKTSKLPKVSLDKTSKAIASNTVDGILAGINFGYAGMVDALISRMKKEMGENTVTVIGTGGLIQQISDEVQNINEINDNLTLEGLRIIFEKNK